MAGEGRLAPDAAAISRRALAVGLFLQRGEFESMVHDPDIAEARQVHITMARRITLRLHDHGLWDDVPENEKRLLARAPGTWTAIEAGEAGWRAEYLAVLLWALSAAEMPPWDARADTDDQIRKLQPPEGSRERTPACTLRTIEEIRGMSEAAQAWHARANTRLVADLEMEVPPGVDLDQIVAEAARAAYEKGYSGKPVAGDFPALQKPYRELSEAEFRFMHMIADQRLRALNWLLGRDEADDPDPRATANSAIPKSQDGHTSTADRLVQGL